MVATPTKEAIMALGPFPLPNFDMPPPPARKSSGLWARMRTRWRRNQLDEASQPAPIPSRRGEHRSNRRESISRDRQSAFLRMGGVEPAKQPARIEPAGRARDHAGCMAECVGDLNQARVSIEQIEQHTDLGGRQSALLEHGERIVDHLPCLREGGSAAWMRRLEHLSIVDAHGYQGNGCQPASGLHPDAQPRLAPER
jgi:hypothetical protein